MTPDDGSWPAPPVWRGRVSIEPLTTALAELDTAAYTDSRDAVRRHSAGRWPTDGFTVSDNLALIAEHMAEHETGTAFAYSLLDPTREREVGCAYLRPLTVFLRRTGTQLLGLPQTPAATAIATFWLIDDARRRPAAATVVGELESWIAAWGAAAPVFRCLPEETETVDSLRRQGLVALEATGQELPYQWFARL